MWRQEQKVCSEAIGQVSGGKAKSRTMNMWHKCEKQRGRLLGVGICSEKSRRRC